MQWLQNQQCGGNQKTRIKFERCELLQHLDTTHDIQSAVSPFNSLTPHQIFVFQTADKLIRTFAEQIFYTGFIHADPHPGNGGHITVHVCMPVYEREYHY